ncbi:hypothetical protein [Levilactobacillus brevis]|nr:hypothetical protein [Levilactobacillus brevis]
MIDWLIPSLGNQVYLVTILGAVVALAGAGIAMVPSANKHVKLDELEGKS